MYELEEIKRYLSITLSAFRIEELYNMISNPKLRVNDDDKQWVASTSESERITVYHAIESILKQHNISYDLSDIITAFNDVDRSFQGENLKPRIPFYILMLDKLV